jgi:hypothetical protein
MSLAIMSLAWVTGPRADAVVNDHRCLTSRQVMVGPLSVRRSLNAQVR